MEDITNPLKQAATSITGSIEKGYLLVRREIIQEKNENEETSTTITLGTLGSGLAEVFKVIHDTSNILGDATTILGSNSKFTSAANKHGYIPIQVQYNPASIRFSGSRGTPSFDHNGTYISNPRPADNVMSLDLYFDTENNATSFMLDKNSKDLVKRASSEIYNMYMSSDDVTTVRYIVELLIGATVFNSTRWVGFAWKNIEFWGELIGVNASYLMFDVEGEPVRAKVSLRIRQNTSNITDLKNNGENERKQNRIEDDANTKKKLKALGKKKAAWTASVSNFFKV